MGISNDAVKAALGSSVSNVTGAGGSTNPALGHIATNGALLIQNVSKLSATVQALTKKWGG